MLCVRAPKLEQRLAELAKFKGATKSHLVREALEAFLNDYDKHEQYRIYEVASKIFLEDRVS